MLVHNMYTDISTEVKVLVPAAVRLSMGEVHALPDLHVRISSSGSVCGFINRAFLYSN